MTWLEQNIDAYRIVSEILGELRRAIRSGLEAIHGETWYRDGLPKEVFDRLVSSKEREKAIDWYEGQYQQIMDYAVFADLVEILEHNAEHFPTLTELAPNNALLQARFIELDVMRAKLGRARPISETELSFLGTFHLRFRKALAELPTPEPSEEIESPADTGSSEVAPPEEPAAAKEVPPAPVAEPAPEPVEPPPVSEPPPPAEEAVVPPSRPATVTPPEEQEEEPPARAPRRAAKSTQKPVIEKRAAPAAVPEPDPEQVADSVEEEDDEPLGSRSAAGPKKLAKALENNEHRAVLRELYREVTTIAEGVWTSDVTPAPLVWEQVTASDWYEVNFSRLGLQPLSVFYEVTGKVEDMTREGADRKELQEFLKETNFAKTLLALRDMFQSNNL